MQKPTYQQISELYKELWQLQRQLEESEQEREMVKESYELELQLNEVLETIVMNARNALRAGRIESALKELEKA